MTALARRSPGETPGDTNARAGPGPRRLSRYELHGKIANGGMATVHLGCVVGAAGFSRTVAISACLHVKIRGWRALQSACVTGTPLEIRNARDRKRHVDHHQNEQR